MEYHSTRKSFVNCEEKGGVSGSGGRVDSAFSKEGVHIRRDVMGTSEIASCWNRRSTDGSPYRHWKARARWGTL